MEIMKSMGQQPKSSGQSKIEYMTAVMGKDATGKPDIYVTLTQTSGTK